MRRDGVRGAGVIGACAAAVTTAALGSVLAAGPAGATGTPPPPPPSLSLDLRPSATASASPTPSAPGAPGALSVPGNPGGSGDPVDPFGGTTPVGPSGDASVGRVTGAVVGPLFDRMRLAAAYVVGTSEAPAKAIAPTAGAPAGVRVTGADGAAWTPPADLRAPRAVDVPADVNGPMALTKDQILWAAYVSAAKAAPASCHLPVTLVAAIGEVESSSLRGRSLDALHNVVPKVVGPALNGAGFASIRDTDGGRLDGDPVWDRAVGPMQFIPSSWRALGVDGNGDGVADPQNIEDATRSTAFYLCSGGKDLSRSGDVARAVLSYNQSQRYLATVTGLMAAMTSGTDAAP